MHKVFLFYDESTIVFLPSDPKRHGRSNTHTTYFSLVHKLTPDDMQTLPKKKKTTTNSKGNYLIKSENFLVDK